MTEPLTYSAAETAVALGVSEDLVRGLISRGVLPVIELGRRKLVPRRAIEIVIDRAVEAFDPDAVLSALAGAGRSSDPGTATGVEGQPGPSGSETIALVSRRASRDPVGSS